MAGGIADLLRQGAAGFDAIIRLSHRFAVDSGLLTDRRAATLIAEIEERGGAASMIMLGNAVFSSSSFPGASVTRLSMSGAKVLP